MAIPIIIGALFHYIDITRYLNSEDLQFIANLTPCDKYYINVFIWTENTFLQHISLHGSMGNLIHDKGERSGLGILVGVMAFNNQNF